MKYAVDLVEVLFMFLCSESNYIQMAGDILGSFIYCLSFHVIFRNLLEACFDMMLS